MQARPKRRPAIRPQPVRQTAETPGPRRCRRRLLACRNAHGRYWFCPDCFRTYRTEPAS